MESYNVQKNGTKVLIKGMNPAARRTLNELSALQRIGKENQRDLYLLAIFLVKI
jgi:hypothetical protein